MMDDNTSNVVKSVRFNCFATVYSSKRTEEDLFSSWYSKVELARFKEDRKDFVRALQQVNFNLDEMDWSKYCSRGYEAYLSVRANKEIRNAHKSMINHVLQEQYRQRELQIVDTQSLKNTCCNLTRWSKERALQLGIQDANISSALSFPLLNAVGNNGSCEMNREEKLHLDEHKGNYILKTKIGAGTTSSLQLHKVRAT